MFSLLNRKPDAQANITGNDLVPNISGTITFYGVYGGSIVIAEISGMPSTNHFHGFHIHDGDNCLGKTGGHYNPTGKLHPEHSGDLPPLLVADGNAFLAFYTNRFYPEDIIGKLVIIHSDMDDFHSQPSGNPGVIIACGKIKESGKN